MTDSTVMVPTPAAAGAACMREVPVPRRCATTARRQPTAASIPREPSVPMTVMCARMTPVTVGEYCSHPANTAPCDDGLYCNGTDTCSGGNCSAHTGSPCLETECNTCQEATNSCFDPSGTVCPDDGNDCTDDECDGAGGCDPSR